MRYIKKYFNDPDKEHPVLNKWIKSNKATEDKKYNEPKVRDFLRKVYHGCCAYCECVPEISSYFEIEHFYPKSVTDKDPVKSGFRNEIKNLHYSCPRCNKLKGDKTSKILSPNYEYNNNGWTEKGAKKIESRLHYIGHKLYAKEGDSDAKNTINMFDLNGENNTGALSRAYLVRHRLVVFAQAYYRIEELYNTAKNRDKNTLGNQLRRFYDDFLSDDCPYVTMIYHNYHDQIYKLLKIEKML